MASTFAYLLRSTTGNVGNCSTISSGCASNEICFITTVESINGIDSFISAASGISTCTNRCGWSSWKSGNSLKKEHKHFKPYIQKKTYTIESPLVLLWSVLFRSDSSTTSAISRRWRLQFRLGFFSRQSAIGQRLCDPIERNNGCLSNKCKGWVHSWMSANRTLSDTMSLVDVVHRIVFV